MGRSNQLCRIPSRSESGRCWYEMPTRVSPWSKRQETSPVGRPTAYRPGGGGNKPVAAGTGSHRLSAPPSCSYTPWRVAAYTRPGATRPSDWIGGMSSRQPFTTGPRPHAGRPLPSSQALRVGSSRYSPRSVPTHTIAPLSGARARTRLGAAYSVQVRPPSVERASPRRWPAHTLPSNPATNASTYWLRRRPHRCRAVAAPAESVISAQLAPRSPESLMPSAVPMYTVSPRVAMPFGATYCHSGPSAPSSQLVQVLPPSVDSPQPFPTVPYQTAPLEPNPKACTKSQEMECAAESFAWRMCSQLEAPERSTKIPCP